MKTKILVTVLLASIAIACSKNVYNTKPTIKIKSLSSHDVQVGDPLTVQLQVTDKEGDISDTLYMQKVRLNQKVRATVRDTLYFKVPDASSVTNGIVQLDLDYNLDLISASNPIENDTLLLRFALKDKAGNVSDTITSDQVVVIR